ncbi:ABC transporter ATP-binding protein [Tessaracoccus sp. MC1865]|uniref:ABC transporter ATP-binding protein n=1 Tax=Tessaracoccus sp. MC1865 TaxID=2760310 RepID=UPI001602600F|nr:ABC transporter ATP-binding protein [Tessaracoccus sp. MC1865]MBB1483173.1 ABC transporter ATP-binding protein [Tessaracoccus sp. MC1865]QTO37404.1 ABC transporter ATP-binding protein [Tessaracoccus sp. MC1865]
MQETAVGPALEVRDLCWQVGGARIVRDVSLAVAPGEMVGVIGPNGAGKTSLFNLISGINPVSSGRVLLLGKDVTKHSVASRARAGLGRTFQTSSLFPRLSVLENVRLAAQQRLGGSLSILKFPRSADDATRLAREMLDIVQLGSRRSFAGDLSHGDKRKLEIAVLLAQDPSVILLDEPMAGVAHADVPGLTEVIRDLNNLGKTVMIVEHHLEVVLGLVSRVAVMHHGELLAFDEPGAIMATPTVQSAYLGDIA